MPDSQVITLMRQWKASLLAGEQKQVSELARRWLGVERRLSGDMELLAHEMTAIKSDGGTVSQEMLMTNVRYRELLVQLQGELDGYTDFADRSITDRQRQLARLGISHAERAIRTQGIHAGFNRLPIESVTNLVGFAGDGTPLRGILEASWPLSAHGLTQELVNGVALGYNPRKTARNMANGMRGSQQRMEVIARNESLRVYTTTNLDSYRASGVVTSYIRLSARDARTCAACLAADGQEYSLDTDFERHVQCRCTLIPKVSGIPLPKYQTGAEWFEEQPATTQRDILGPGRYGLWARGDITNFKDFATVKPNAVWGDAIVPTPLKELVG